MKQMLQVNWFNEHHTKPINTVRFATRVLGYLISDGSTRNIITLQSNISTYVNVDHTYITLYCQCPTQTRSLPT